MSRTLSWTLARWIFYGLSLISATVEAAFGHAGRKRMTGPQKGNGLVQVDSNHDLMIGAIASANSRVPFSLL
jgi:hypothetical protein